jgi:isoamylase
VNRLGTFFDIIQQDPVLSQVKLIAEPWDVGPGGYQVGNFPVGWAEWNGRYRDAVRHFWRGDPGRVGEMASRLTGSSDIYQWTHRGAYASINFVTAHDGFTLNDLVSYERKHNLANGENNRDGTDDNISRNWGVEGPTSDPAILAQRLRMMKNFLATLFFSQGVPMLSHGDEVARTQRGNNNAYCQDNPISWMNWELDGQQLELLEFTRSLIAVREANPVLRRRHFFRGQSVGTDGVKDVTWVRADGAEMSAGDWSDPELRALGMVIDGGATDETDARGRLIRGDTLALVLNGGERAVRFELPRQPLEGQWVCLVETASTVMGNAGQVTMEPQSLVLLRYQANR